MTRHEALTSGLNTTNKSEHDEFASLTGVVCSIDHRKGPTGQIANDKA